MFIDFESEGEMEGEEEEDANKEAEDYIDAEKIFEPDDIKNRYEREDDKKIKETDIPERL